MKAFVSVIGMDKRGIIKDVSTVLSNRDVNIININQSIVEGYFTMVMFVDLEALDCDFESLKSELSQLGKDINMKIRIQHEDIFHAMHKI